MDHQKRVSINTPSYNSVTCFGFDLKLKSGTHTYNRCIRVLGFFGREICLIAQERDRKARFKKSSLTFGRNLRPKAREQNSATESRR